MVLPVYQQINLYTGFTFFGNIPPAGRFRINASDSKGLFDLQDMLLTNSLECKPAPAII